MPTRHRSVAVAIACFATSVLAADQAILGNKLLLRDPSAGADQTKRTIVATGRERLSPNTLVGDPTVSGSGGTIALFLNGATSPSFVAELPQGSTPSGAAYWSGSPSSGFKYADAKGVRGPVKKVKVKRSGSGTFGVQLRMSGKHGALPAPPNPGTSGCVLLALGVGSGAERYSLQFGTDSEVTNQPGRLFQAKRPTTEGVCPPIPCDATTYPACGGSCGPGAVCRPLSGDAATGNPAGSCACVAQDGPTDCPAGTAYLTSGDHIDTPIGCAPIPTCNDVSTTGYPGCAGGVPAGAVCQALRVLEPGFGVDASICIAYPPGESCASVCSISGAGACPGGQVCAVSSGFDGMDCGCFTPPFCLGDATCGGSCPDGACTTCPAGVCAPNPVCFCSTD
jgi:hypothetical protein